MTRAIYPMLPADFPAV